MSNITNIAAIIASVIAATGGLIYIWKEIHSLDKQETEKLKTTINKVKGLVMFFLGLASFSTLLFLEVASPDPINRLAALKIALFVALLLWWSVSFLILRILKTLIVHAKLMDKSASITEKLIDP